MKSQNISLDDVVGLEKQKEKLYDSLFLIHQNKELYSQLVKFPDKIKRRKIFLLHGPPGTGKTFLAKAMAYHYDVDFTFIQSTQFLNEYVGAGARKIREIYEKAKGVLVIDEIDAIAKSRNSTSSEKTHDIFLQLLICLDGGFGNYDLSTIMQTNKPESLDSALMSRIPLSNRLYFPIPNEKQRELILEKQLSYHNHKIKSISSIVEKTNNYDGRQIEDLVDYARNLAIKDKRNYLLIDDFESFFKNKTKDE